MDAMWEGRRRGVQVIRHRGHALEFAEYGRPDGACVLYFHGTPGSRMEAEFLAGAALRNGVRLVAIDRPGHGGSSHRTDRQVSEWADDVAAVGDHLGLDRFAVLGFSGGGPHVLACLAGIPQRISVAGLIAPAGRHGPLRTAFEWWTPRLYLPAARLLARLPHPRPGAGPGRTVGAVLIRSWRHALSRGHHGAVRDAQAIVEDWGLSIAEVAATLRRTPRPPVVLVWNGARDRVVNPLVGAQMAADLGARRRLFPQAGHLGVLLRHGDAMMAELAEAVRVAGLTDRGPGAPPAR